MRVFPGRYAMTCLLREVGELRYFEGSSHRSESCTSYVAGYVPRILQQVTSLPDALGEHACECGHPEMQCLPHEVLHCPACGSEVTPLDPVKVRLSAIRRCATTAQGKHLISRRRR
jgi:hypothetical protein